ncbi:NAD-dependent protein deacetylase sirtuin-2 [Halyomorpha halys]|uniref:NAD-dependent protein deacetylase sirtuin-2 n=1 Tax=Halyomorpha halys TaxID=286706 RepID=UPI0006D509BC|nr:NAD-dependent protein deacetylase sirtuin-2-like [Halyomorpha halys]XP_014291549.1 NAD-dependent protein deacetylase sirtuin-2-like [Halyomorpha halys]XP_014291550.1 NAD-dependent protein deacetylase sirtuin-2-like [Halyomorpha halys]
MEKSNDNASSKDYETGPNKNQGDEENEIKSNTNAEEQLEKLTDTSVREKPKSDSRHGDDMSHETDVVDELATQLQNIKLPNQILCDLSIYGIVSYIKKRPCLNIITMVGAGISTAAGIPDFRSPETGIYNNLQKYNLPYPQAIFELEYFKKYPEPFYQLTSDLLPGEYSPTKSHYFIKLLEEKGILLRHYTQNIDNLDRLAGISEDKLIEAHGTFYQSHCLGCKNKYGFEWLKRQIHRKRIPHCIHCNSLVKPDIIFFGESLPHRFYQKMSTDFLNCDLLIIMGSSLEVEPFASLALRPNKMCPRLIINLVPVGDNIGFQFGKANNNRDVLWTGDCDTGCQILADELGWGDELIRLMKSDDTIYSNTLKGTAETSC